MGGIAVCECFDNFDYAKEVALQTSGGQVWTRSGRGIWHCGLMLSLVFAMSDLSFLRLAMKVGAYNSNLSLSMNYVYHKQCITVVVLQIKRMQTLNPSITPHQCF